MLRLSKDVDKGAARDFVATATALIENNSEAISYKTKICLQCDETVKWRAKICKHCGNTF